ncbi:hypothetical protein NOJ28_11210 [Neorhizobium galegae]|uniref:hypothetical protein n=1 Tax=Neorhizobium galegae TaxID=399 RepID=UPI0021084218|nr:hypothetical protein [Neorhizobium galegae]MCQ1766104.1 hypothetical protein [Neorhizobium galegae]MCQ1845018.1 hypothetical protein [Neorhizobium galegae]
MAVQPNPNFGPAYAQCMWLLLFVVIANALVGLAISVLGQDVCSIARSGIRYAWPPNESFVSVSDLTNKHICNTVIVRSILSCSLFMWLLIAIYKTAQHLTPHFDPVMFAIVVVLGMTSYWFSGFPAVSGLHYYQVGLDDWWWVGFIKSGLLIVGFYLSSLLTIYILLCAFRKFQ